ncbi:nuclear RNA export factor 2-like [Chironomus tepperi]|uniref:nuclear RNA export factor 2-like n=1 Tax=Chironomus tepperi TaxID=113505 RepID=UPI00391F457B
MTENTFSSFGKADNIKIRTLVNPSSISQLKNYNYPRRIEMQGIEQPIIVNDSTVNVYTPLDCDRFYAPQNNGFSLISVYHQGLPFTKDEIINGFYDTVGETFFIPIAYKQDRYIDYFLVKNQNDAMRELVRNKLQIQVKDWKLPLLIKIEISVSNNGHIKPRKSIGTFIIRKVKENSAVGILDLSEIQKEPEFVDMYISLRSLGVSKTFFDEINNIRGIKSSSNSNFRAMKFCNNEIQSLEPFKRLFDFKNIEVLDLSNNNITDVNEFNNLMGMNLNEIIINNNPVTNHPQFEQIVQKILPNLKTLNSKVIFSLSNMMNSIQNGNNDIPNVGDGTLIKSENLMQYRNRIEKIVNEKYWAQVTLHHNKRYTVQEIMKELSSNLLKEVHFYPCYLKRLDNYDEFYLYRNFDALRILFLNGLKIQMPKNSFTIDVHIRLNVAEYREGEVNWSSKIANVLKNRVKEDTLDLNDFPRDPEFSKLTVLLNSSKTLDYVLTLVKRINPNITRINAENCNISNCKGFECLFSFPKLYALNLKNNYISNLSDFSKCTSVVEVHLDGNPVCNKSSYDYIGHVRENFKEIVYVDGHRVYGQNRIVTHQNFLFNKNAYIVINAFVDYFFHLWDSFERSKVRLLYNDYSVFTMSVNYEFNEKNSSMTFAQIYPRIQNHMKFQRNLLKLSDMNSVASKVHIGKNNIAMVFNDMSRTRHDFSTFTVDVPFFSEEQRKIGIIVSGVFEEFLYNTEDNSLPYSFSRTFLFDVIDGNFIIKNDQLLLRQPTTAQMEMLRSGHRAATKNEIKEQCRVLLPSAFENQALKLSIFQKLTECSKSFCKKLLEDNSWDLKVALASFTYMMERNEIPDEKFKFK